MRYIIFSVMLIFTSCAFSMAPRDWSQADFGSKPEGTAYLEIIELSIKPTLIDPDSLKLACAEPRRGSVLEGVGFGTHRLGWVVYCSVNAKNRFGGYSGAKPYVYLLRGNNFITSQTNGDAKEGLEYSFMP